MKTNNSLCSPHLLISTPKLELKGAPVQTRSCGISIPELELPLHSGFVSPKERQPETARNTTRYSPVIWEARNELARRGLIAIPVRKNSQVMLDIIAWDPHKIYFIAVRRTRGDPAVRDITTRYQQLISDLRTLNIPEVTRVQLWICIHHSFQVYDVLSGGLMSRSLP